MSKKSQPQLEIRFGYLVPIFVALGALLNLAITQPPSLHLGRVSSLFIQAGNSANYGRVTPGLTFPGLDPNIVDETRRDRLEEPLPPAFPLQTGTPVPEGTQTGPGPDAPTLDSGSGVLPVLPTVVGAVPTVVGVVPTVVGIVPTVVGVVPTVVGALPTVIGVVPTVVNVVPTVVNVVPTVVNVVPTVINILPTLLPPILPPLFP